jgi:hypothetical protein
MFSAIRTTAIGTAVLALAAGFATPAGANPTITALFPSTGFSATDEAVIGSALNFYRTNMTNTFSVTVAFGTNTTGGATSQAVDFTDSYNDYYNNMVANSSGNATDLSAIASLGGGPHTNNPVTGSSNTDMNTSLAAALGIAPQTATTFPGCGGLVANACITISTSILNASGSPTAALFGQVEHAFDEVLGTSSALPNGGGTLPADPDVADLFRYIAPGVRSFALNTSTSIPCTGSPTAYLSIDGGVTNLNPYNNCNNGGDYGDWNFADGFQVQDAFGPDGVAASLNLSSPEVKLLDAIGYNFASRETSVPEPASVVLLLTGVAGLCAVRRKRATSPRAAMSTRRLPDRSWPRG